MIRTENAGVACNFYETYIHNLEKQRKSLEKVLQQERALQQIKLKSLQHEINQRNHVAHQNVQLTKELNQLQHENWILFEKCSNLKLRTEILDTALHNITKGE